jgi:anthranilate phosphoribosyltransferase
VQFVHANSSETLDSLGSKTIPQVEILADGIRRFKITMMGVGLGGGDKPADQKPTMSLEENAASIRAAFSGVGG